MHVGCHYHRNNADPDIAVAANVILEKYSQQSAVTNSLPSIRRILIIDLDVHQGKGSFDPLRDVIIYQLLIN